MNFLIILALFLIGGIGGYYIKPSKIEFYYPPSSYSNARLTTGINCESIVSNLLIVKSEKNKTIESEIIKGTDKISVKLKNNKLKFLTSAAVGSGVTEGDEMTIIQNNNKYLTAYGEFTYGGMDSFVLNKETGKAIWSKSQPNYILANDVENQTFLLDCH